MITTIAQQRGALAELCRWHRVRVLEVFGSAADGTFRPKSSDLDFLVEFFPLAPGEHFDSYFGLWGDLEGLFARKVDLVEAGPMRNPYFERRVNESRKLVYGA